MPREFPAAERPSQNTSEIVFVQWSTTSWGEQVPYRFLLPTLREARAWVRKLRNLQTKQLFPHHVMNGIDRDSKAGGAKRGWEEGRGHYECIDAMKVRVPRKNGSRCVQSFVADSDSSSESDSESSGAQLLRLFRKLTEPVLRYGILRRFDFKSKELRTRFFVADAEFSRDISLIIAASQDGKTFVFPKTVGGAQEGAFENCGKLRSAALREGTETFGSCGGEGCSPHGWLSGDGRIAQFLLPATLRVLEDRALQDAKGLAYVKFREGSRLEKIGKYCFNCSGIEAITIPSSVTVICEGAFRCCENLKRISFQEGSKLTKIGRNCFEHSGIEEFCAPPGLRRIEHRALAGCVNLKRVVLNEGLTTIGEDGMLFCSEDNDPYYIKDRSYRPSYGSAYQKVGIEEITLPSTLEKIGDNTFCGCLRLKVVWVRDGCRVNVKRCVNDSVAVLPMMQGSLSLRDLRTQNDVVIPEGVQEIGEGWFKRCEAKSVTIPKSVKRIGPYAFCDCLQLARVTFAPGSELEEIGHGCFSASSIERIVVPNGLEKVPDRAFSSCRSLKEVAFEEGSRLNAIEEYAFWGCTNLAKIDFPKGLKSIGKNAFYCCERLKGVQFPDGLEKIGDLCFSYSGLAGLVLPAGVMEVGAGAFQNCKQLKRARLREGSSSALGRLKAETFAGCESLETVEAPDSVEQIEEDCFKGTKIEELALPDALREMDENALRGCGRLRVVRAGRDCALDIGKYVRGPVEVRQK